MTTDNNAVETGIVGCIDGISGGVVFGWALDAARGGQPVNLEVLIDDRVVATVPPTQLRPEVAQGRSASSRCGFRFDVCPFLPAMKGQALMLRDASTRHVLPGTPILLDPAAGWGAIEGIGGIDVHGWAVQADTSSPYATVEILFDDQVVGSVVADLPRPDLQSAGAPHLKCGFRFAVPARWHDGIERSVSARVRGNPSRLRSYTAGKFVCLIDGRIDSMTPQSVDGWLVNTRRLGSPIRFDLWVNDRIVARSALTLHPRQDVIDTLFTGVPYGTPVGFHIPFPVDFPWDKEINTAQIRIPDSDDLLLQAPAAWVNRSLVTQEIERLAGWMNGDGPEISSEMQPMLKLAVRQLVAPGLREALAKVRSAPERQASIVMSRPEATPGWALREQTVPVDVIIPVYKGLSETLDCLQSVLASRGDAPMNIVVINDCSPDAELTSELRALAATEPFTLLENEHNLGFVATANKGMRLNGNRDVVLLNADTVVPSGWLGRLRQAAYSAPNIGTVTPFSNRATIFSLPRTCHDNDLPLDLSAAEIDAICAERNPRVVVDVPTGVGYCMYIRRAALDEVGWFDEDRWAKGYGEENDFCVRAAANGWRSVAACDLFVQHHGSMSFDQEKEPRIKANLAILREMYPDYLDRVQRFLESDPLAIARGRVTMALLARLAPRSILFVTHGIGGGTEKAVRDFCRLHQAGGEQVLVLRSAPTGGLILSPAIAPHEETLVAEYPFSTTAEVLADQLRELSIEHVVFHHSLGFRPDIWQLPERLNVPYDVMVHDFFLVCPRIQLIDDSGIYCGQPTIAGCERCVKDMRLDQSVSHGVSETLKELGGTVTAWRAFHGERLRGARRVTAPSEDACRRVRRYLPDQPIAASPHPEPALTFKRRRWNGVSPHCVAVIGAIGQPKGSDLLLALAQFALREELPVRFVVIGFTNQDARFEAMGNVEVTGKYEPEDIAHFVSLYGCTTALFLSVWPETYSYTLSEAWRAGLFPLVLDIGAQAERVRASGIGRVIPLGTDPKVIAQALLDELQRQTAPADQ